MSRRWSKICWFGKARCIARFDAFEKFSDLLSAILTAIETIAKNFDANIVEATQKKQNRHLWELVSFKLLWLSEKNIDYCDIAIIEKLQGIDTDLAKVMSDVKLLKETLKELRAIADMHHAVWFQEF